MEETARTAKLAGAVYALAGAAMLFGYYHVPLARGDLSAMSAALLAPELRFNLGVTIDVIAAALGIPLALLLYQLLHPIGKAQARLMAGLLAVAVPISFAGALSYVAARLALQPADWNAAFTASQREALAGLFLRLHDRGVMAEEIFWGLWLFPFGMLVIRSRFLPRALGVLLLVAGSAYVIHSLATLVLGGQRFPFFERAAMLGRAGELPVFLWLLFKGVDVRGSDPAVSTP